MSDVLGRGLTVEPSTASVVAVLVLPWVLIGTFVVMVMQPRCADIRQPASVDGTDLVQGSTEAALR